MTWSRHVRFGAWVWRMTAAAAATGNQRTSEISWHWLLLRDGSNEGALLASHLTRGSRCSRTRRRRYRSSARRSGRTRAGAPRPPRRSRSPRRTRAARRRRRARSVRWVGPWPNSHSGWSQRHAAPDDDAQEVPRLRIVLTRCATRRLVHRGRRCSWRVSFRSRGEPTIASTASRTSPSRSTSRSSGVRFAQAAERRFGAVTRCLPKMMWHSAMLCLRQTSRTSSPPRAHRRATAPVGPLRRRRIPPASLGGVVGVSEVVVVVVGGGLRRGRRGRRSFGGACGTGLSVRVRMGGASLRGGSVAHRWAIGRVFGGTRIRSSPFPFFVAKKLKWLRAGTRRDNEPGATTFLAAAAAPKGIK